MKCPKCGTEVETHEEKMKKHAEEMAKLTINCAKRTGWLFLPMGLFGTPVPFPVKWFPKLEKALNVTKEGS